MNPLLSNPYVFPSVALTKKWINPSKTLLVELGEAEVDAEGLADPEGEADAEAELEPEGELLWLAVALGEVDWEAEAEGEADPEGDCDEDWEWLNPVSPSSFNAWLQVRVSVVFLISRPVSILAEPLWPRSECELIPPSQFLVSSIDIYLD